MGSNTNPLVDPGFCGEIVDGRFFLNLAGVLDASYACEIPAGATIVASAGYAILWKPTDARSDQRLRHLLNPDLHHFGPPHGRLDGEVVDLGPSFAKTNVYRIAVGEDSLIQTADPDFPNERTTPRWQPVRGCSGSRGSRWEITDWSFDSGSSATRRGLSSGSRSRREPLRRVPDDQGSRSGWRQDRSGDRQRLGILGRATGSQVRCDRSDHGRDRNSQERARQSEQGTSGRDREDDHGRM